MAKGGARPGAGRKSMHRKAVQFRLTQESIDFVKDTAKNSGVSQSDILEVIIGEYQDKQ